jgi:hypothetical protein
LKIPNLQEFTKAELLSVYDKIKPLPQRRQYNHQPTPVASLALSTDDEMEGLQDDEPFACQSKDTIESLDFQNIRINSPKLDVAGVPVWGSQSIPMGSKRCFGVLNSVSLVDLAMLCKLLMIHQHFQELDYIPSKKYKHS